MFQFHCNDDQCTSVMYQNWLFQFQSNKWNLKAGEYNPSASMPLYRNINTNLFCIIIDFFSLIKICKKKNILFSKFWAHFYKKISKASEMGHKMFPGIAETTENLLNRFFSLFQRKICKFHKMKSKTKKRITNRQLTLVSIFWI